jgi:cyanophycinase
MNAYKIQMRGQMVLLALFCSLFGAVRILSAQERLVVVGGGKRPQAAMKTFVGWAGGNRSNILVIPWATSEPQSSFDYLKQDMMEFKPDSIVLAPVAPLTDEKKAAFLAQLKQATGVFFTGGDQVKTMEVLKDASLLKALQDRYRSGVVFGGTSAGAAIMSTEMITGEGDFTVIDAKKVETKGGLGLLPDDVIVDQHFIRRQRQNRLFGLILRDDKKFGVGVDEDTALLVVDNRFAQVTGLGHVMTVLPGKTPGGLVIQLLNPGEWLDLRKRAIARKVPVKITNRPNEN